MDYFLHKSRQGSLEQAEYASEDQDSHACYKSADGPTSDCVGYIDMEES